MKKLFFAYPSQDSELSAMITAGIQQFNAVAKGAYIVPWPSLSISGQLLHKEVISAIERSDLLIADVSSLNLNVTYEIGYAIGQGKPLWLCLNETHRCANDRARIGIYDVLGYEAYLSKDELANHLLAHWFLPKPIIISEDLDERAPIFLLDAYEKSELVNHIKTCIKKRLVYFRSFDPQEQSRLSVESAIREVSRSAGVVVSLVPSRYPESFSHNLRAAFVVGLAHGLSKVVSIIQLGDDKVPLDFRDDADSCYSKDQIEKAIDKFALKVTPAIQGRPTQHPRIAHSRLQKLDIGGSVAENEFLIIDEYYLETDAYLRAGRGEAKLIIGRKGSGKTALFGRVRNQKRTYKQNVVIDLKPEGYKLVKFKEKILDALSPGSLMHVVTAIWEYVLLLEVAYKLLEKDRLVHTRDRRLSEKYEMLDKLYRLDEYFSEGDFSERLSILIDEVSSHISRSEGKGKILNTKEVSETIYKHSIGKLKDSIIDYLKEKKEVWILVDNLDKGWPASGVGKNDVILIQALVEAMEKIDREFRQKNDIDFRYIVLIRSDVYQNLVESSSDRGKILPVSVDWSDSAALKELLRLRFVYSGYPDNLTVEEIWSALGVAEVDGVPAIDLLIQQSLYRPRALLDLIQSCKSLAVNRRHDIIQVLDVSEAIRTFSIRLIDELNYEIQDMEPNLDGFIFTYLYSEPSFNKKHF
jgi:hypothetical protein